MMIYVTSDHMMILVTMRRQASRRDTYKEKDIAEEKEEKTPQL